MHKDFADWYRAANIEPDGNALPKRWAAIESFEVGRIELADAARLFYGFTPRSPKFIESFRAALQEADAAVKMSDNDQELAVLAGAILVDAIERCPPPLSYFAALATVCPAAKNLHKPPVVPAIPELATHALAAWSSARFTDQSSDISDDAALLSAASLEKLKKHCKAAEIAALEEPLGEIFQAVQKMQQRSQEMGRQLSLQSEETNMLWWLLGGYSRDTKKPFSTYSPAGACLIAGKELADLTRELPGPIAAVAFLDKLTRANRDKFPKFVSIESAVNDTHKEWRQCVLSRHGLEELTGLTPVFAALKAASNVPEGESWSAIYIHATGVKADAKIAPNELADQVYLEGMLFRAWTLLDSHE